MNILTTRACRKAIETYGEVHQITKALEEMSELSKELLKLLCEVEAGRKFGFPPNLNPVLADHIAEEMADVMIMVTQLEMIFKNTGDVRRWIDRKTERLAADIAKRESEQSD